MHTALLLQLCIHLSNLRFADDVLLFASTRGQLTIMLAELKEAAARCGLKLHAEKTKILTNASVVNGRETPSHTKLGDDDVEILSAEHTARYLGRAVCAINFHEAELESRITAAWRCFHKHKQELTSRQYPLRHRLRLFDAAVTATVLYGCEAWTLKETMKRRLRAVQRKMLRMVLGSRRRLARVDDTSSIPSCSAATHSNDDEDEGSQYELEPWCEFLKRVTHVAEQQASAAGLQEWLSTWRKRSWRWARKVATDSNGKWSQTALRWCPQLHASRKAVGGPRHAQRKDGPTTCRATWTRSA